MSEERAWPRKPPVLSREQHEARERFILLWHQELPKKYSFIERFNHGSVAKLPVKPGIKTLEIGAGLGAHSKFENLKTQDYYCLEYRKEFCLELSRLFAEDHIIHGDIEQRQAWPNGFFGRIIAIHVLEHLRDLPKALDEIERLLSGDGVFDVVLPCEGEWSYLLARKVSAERLFKKHFRMDYGPIIKNEHVSTLQEIQSLLFERFDVVSREYFPMKIPVAALNLVVSFRLQKKRR